MLSSDISKRKGFLVMEKKEGKKPTVETDFARLQLRSPYEARQKKGGDGVQSETKARRGGELYSFMGL